MTPASQEFKNKKVRVQLNMPIKSETKAENAQLLKDVDEDRKFLIQATIVRVMKSRKTMKHNVRLSCFLPGGFWGSRVA